MRYVMDPVDVLVRGVGGGKARALAAAQRAGLPVPAWRLVTAEACLGALVPTAAAQAPAAWAGDGLQDLALETGVADEIASALRVLAPHGERVAVRSSSADEDGERHSFAGQLETFLDVEHVDVPGRVCDVWRSGVADRVAAYRTMRGLDRPPALPAVIVQRMLSPRAAGVAFSADPVGGRRGRVVICAIAGLGDRLVSGRSQGETWHMDRGSDVVRVDAAGSPRVLDRDDARRVAELARQAERAFGVPQDIEWAFEEGRLWLLQARPITALESVPDPDAAVVIWDNSNIVESYSGVTTPLTFSFASDVYAHVYRQFCLEAGVQRSLLAAEDDAFSNLLGLVRGRLYYNLLNWYRVLALLPGFSRNRAFMEQMMGVGEPLPDAVGRGVIAAARVGPVRDTARLARAVVRLSVAALTVGRRVRAFRRRLDDALTDPNPPLGERRPDELVAHYRELRSRLLTRWDAPILNDFLAMVAYGVLRTLTKRWLHEADGPAETDLVGGEGGMVSAEPARRLGQMAAAIADSPTLVSLFVNGPADDAVAAMASRPGLEQAFTRYIADFGDRTVNELKLESLTLHDDSTPLVRAIGGLAARMAAGEGKPETAARRRLEARARAGTALRWRPHRRLLFTLALGVARRRLRDRENLRLDRTRLFGRVRRLFLELGARLHANGCLADARDVFYLEVDEVLAFVEGRATTVALPDLVSLRRREFDAYRDGPAPDDRFETRGPVYRGHSFTRANPLPRPAGEKRCGLGCSPGRVVGSVIVVRDPRDVVLTRPAVLVAHHTDPGWITVFPSALGVLVERGSLLSHAAIVARELGIPAVVCVPGLTAWLRDGDRVAFDGSTGVVTRVGRTDDGHAK